MSAALDLFLPYKRPGANWHLVSLVSSSTAAEALRAAISAGGSGRIQALSTTVSRACVVSSSTQPLPSLGLSWLVLLPQRLPTPAKLSQLRSNRCFGVSHCSTLCPSPLWASLSHTRIADSCRPRRLPMPVHLHLSLRSKTPVSRVLIP